MGVVFLTGVCLSMDAFSVSLCKGLGMKRINWRQALTIAFFFGGFQAVMPLAGWLLGSRFEEYIVSVDHWVAFGLLLLIGVKMIHGSFKEDGEVSGGAAIGELAVLALATSIDALAVGITLAFLETPILAAGAIIGLTTFFICLAGVALGHKFGVRFKTKAEILGGVMLIVIGGKILLEHLSLWS